MSEDDKDSIIQIDVLDDDPESIVERHPRSNLPLLPVIILSVIFILYSYVSTHEESVPGSIDTVSSIEAEISTEKQSGTLPINFHQLVSMGDVKEVEEQIVSVDKETVNNVVSGMTPIMLAAARGSVEIIDLLFTQGADPNKRGSDQRTALQYAAEKNHIDAAKRLLAYGADIDAFDSGRLTPLIMAASRGYTDLGLLFIEKGADVNIQHVQGWTALIDAAAHNDVKLVNALLEAGAKRDLKANNGLRAIDYAEQYGFKNMVEILSE